MKPPLSQKRRAAAERAHKAVAKKMATVTDRPQLDPDKEIRRLVIGIVTAIELGDAGLHIQARKILVRLIGEAKAPPLPQWLKDQSA